MRNLIPIALVLALVACTPVATNVTNNTTPLITIPSDQGADVETSTGTDSGTQATPETPEGSDSGNFAAHLTFTEGDLIRLKSLAVDPDKDKVILVFAPPFDKDGLWQTKVGDAGDYPVSVTATDSKGASTAQRILVSIAYANRPPVIEGPDSISLKEGETVKLDYKAVDPDGTEAILSYSGWMKGASYQTTYNDSGDHEVIVTAEDGKTSIKKTVAVHVDNVNRAPVLSFGKDTYTVVELQKVSVKATASDPDADKVTVTFGAPLDASGSWTPALGDAGTKQIEVNASDGMDTTSQMVSVTVTPANRPPSISVPTEDSVLHFKEGDTIDLRLALVITDPEGEEVAVRYSGWMKSPVYATTYDDAGSHEVTVEASDDSNHIATTKVIILVDDVNRPPVFVQPA